MKINKLFHWLYAFLMFLPLVVFLPTGLYYAFNEHADNGTQTATANIEYQYKYQTNEVNSLNDIVANHIYHADYLDITDDISVNNEVQIKIYTFEDFVFDTDIEQYLDNIYFNNYDNENNYILITLYANTFDYNVMLTNGNAYSSYTMSSEDVYLNITNCDFSLEGGFNEYLLLLQYGFGYTASNYSASNYNVIESATASIEYNNDTSIVNAMSSAWDNVWQLPFFSWAGSSFLAQPFNYITVLFGIPNNSVFVFALSYWLSISIIWMVFDIVIYVPMLIHRWLDKASLS